MNSWRYIDSGSAAGLQNMYIDEGLLAEAAFSRFRPVLRFYTWNPPAVSLGRFQDAETAVNHEACRRLGIDIVRRITGGRAVLHAHELTYSIVARTDDSLFPNNVLGTYKVIAEGLVAGLRNMGLPAEIVSRSGRHAAMVKKNTKEPACFSSPSWYEIVVHGKKIIGSAQRRIGGAFLQHGSILIGYDPSLEASVIPGCGSADSATSIQNELRKEVSLSEIKEAFISGFEDALQISFA